MRESRFIIRLNPVDCLTLSGVFTSGVAMILGQQGYAYLATAILFVAMLGDALDGMLARKYRLERPFGRYLDGFMDVLIYLVAPSLILMAHGFNGVWALFLLGMVMCGCIRLSVFNDIGNIQESNGLAYLGMPVFWSVFLLAGYLLLEPALPVQAGRAVLAVVLVMFSTAMLLRRPFFKFKKLWQILGLTIGGALLFTVLYFMRGPGHV